MIDEKDIDLWIESVIGEHADRFFKNELGRWISAQAIEEVEGLLDELKIVDPTDSNKIRSLQFEIKTREHTFRWLQNAIQAGRQALGILDGDAIDEKA